MTVKVPIADDHSLIREALSRLFSVLDDKYAISTVTDGDALMSWLE